MEPLLEGFEGKLRRYHSLEDGHAHQPNCQSHEFFGDDLADYLIKNKCKFETRSFVNRTLSVRLARESLPTKKKTECLRCKYNIFSRIRETTADDRDWVECRICFDRAPKEHFTELACGHSWMRECLVDYWMCQV